MHAGFKEERNSIMYEPISRRAIAHTESVHERALVKPIQDLIGLTKRLQGLIT